MVTFAQKFDITLDDHWQVYCEFQGEYAPLSTLNKPALISRFTYDAKQGSSGSIGG